MCRHKSDILLGLICGILLDENSHSNKIMMGEKKWKTQSELCCFVQNKAI